LQCRKTTTSAEVAAATATAAVSGHTMLDLLYRQHTKMFNIGWVLFYSKHFLW
jgi:hypothetical protein